MPIHYREYGTDNQALMLFLHGGGVSGWMWERQAEYFSRDYHCIIPDLPGHGSSPPQAGRFSMHDCAVSIIELIRAKAEDKPVTLIGFSLGAQVIVQLLSLEPGLAHAAIINSALTVPNPSMIRWIRPSVRLTFPLIQRNVDDILTASDAELVDGMRFLAARMKLLVEPTGCLGLAAARQRKDELRGKRVGILLSGGNVDLARFCALLGG